MKKKTFELTVTLPIHEYVSVPDDTCRTVIVGTKAFGEALEQAIEKLYPGMKLSEVPDFDDETETECPCGSTGWEFLLEKK